MKNLLNLIGTILLFAGAAIVISGVFSLIQWLGSLIGIFSSPTWQKFLYGALGLFVLFVLIGIWNVIKNWNKI